MIAYYFLLCLELPFVSYNLIEFLCSFYYFKNTLILVFFFLNLKIIKIFLTHIFLKYNYLFKNLIKKDKFIFKFYYYCYITTHRYTIIFIQF